MQVAHEHKVPLIVDNTFGMGGMYNYNYSPLGGPLLMSAYVRVSDPSH